MRRTASEVLRSLEMRVARLERQAYYSDFDERDMEDLEQTYIEEYGHLHDEDEIDEDGYGVEFKEIGGLYHWKHKRSYVLFKSVGEFDNVWIVAHPARDGHSNIYGRFTNPKKLIKWWNATWEDTLPEQRQRLKINRFYTDLQVRDLT